MTSLRLRTQIIEPLVGSICFLGAGLFASREGLLNPAGVNARDSVESFFLLALGLVFCVVSVFKIREILSDYIFYIADQSFSQDFKQLDPGKTLLIGPFTGLKDKGLTISLHYEAPWERQLGSFRLWPESPLMSYHARLYGRAGNDVLDEASEDVLIEERTFRQQEEGGDGAKYRPAWKEDTFMVARQFDEYFLKIDMNIDSEKLIWPREKKRNHAPAEPVQPSVLLKIRLNATLRWQDLPAWRLNPELSLNSAQIQLLD